jgi:hypothetical protein
VARGSDLGRKLGRMLTTEGTPRRRVRVEKNRRQVLGPKIAGAAAGVGEQHGSVVELVDVAAVPDGGQSELSWTGVVPAASKRLQAAPWAPGDGSVMVLADETAHSTRRGGSGIGGGGSHGWCGMPQQDRGAERDGSMTR